MSTSRKQQRRQAAWQRFTVLEHAQTNAAYRAAKIIEQVSLQRALGIQHSGVLVSAAAALGVQA